MRIAIFHNLPSGGAKRTVYETVRRLATRHHVEVFTLTTANHSFADIRPHVEGYRIFSFNPVTVLPSPYGRVNPLIRLIDLLRLRILYHKIARHIDRIGFDVVLVHPCRFENSPSIIGDLQGPPSVYYCHEPLRLGYEESPPRSYYKTHVKRRQILDSVDPLPGLYYKLLRRTDRYNARSADKLLVNSEFIREAVQRIYRVDGNVCYHGVDTQLFRPLHREKNPVLLSVGSLTPLKGFDFLIKAIARLPIDRRPPFVIASNFQNLPERDYLRLLAAELEVELILLRGVTDDRLRELYNEAAVVVYAPVREPFGLVPLEAMACETPVVGVQEGGLQESIVHEHSGFLVKRDPEQFASAVLCLLDSPALASDFGRNGRIHVKRHWTWDKATTRLEEHLKASAKFQ